MHPVTNFWSFFYSSIVCTQWKDAEVCGRTKSIKMFTVYTAVLGTIDYVCVKAKLLQSCPALWDSMDHRPPVSSAQGILQTRILEWVSMPSFSGSSQPRVETTSLMPPTLSGGFFTTSATREAYNWLYPARHLSLALRNTLLFLALYVSFFSFVKSGEIVCTL